MNKYQDIIDNGYSFDIGKYMSEGWELFKKGAWSFIGFTIVAFLIYFVVIFIPIIGLIGPIILGALVGGIFIFCRNLLSDKAEFGQFFQGFESIGQIFLYYLVLLVFFLPVFGLMFAFIFPFEIVPELFSGRPDPELVSRAMEEKLANGLGMFVIAYFAIIVLSVAISTLYTFAMPLIVDDKMSFWHAMETSRKVVSKKFFPIFGLLFILGLILAIGSTVTCLLGLLVLFPYMYCTIFAAYNDVFKPHDSTISNQIETFGTPEIDTNTEAEDS